MKALRVCTIVLVALALLAVLPAAAQEDDGPARVGLRPDAPPYAIRGPYWVGVMEMVIEPESERPLPVTVWYPALNPDKQAENITYTVPMKWFPMPEWDYVIYGHALLDAVPNRADAPYPVVVFSHGFSISAAWYAYLIEHLASYGFVVISPDHPGYSDDEDEDPFRDALPSGIQRPQAISRTIDFAVNLNQADEMFTGLIDIEEIALAGHSAGGFTSLVSGGARLSFEAFKAFCAANPSMLCENGIAQEAHLAQLAGFDSTPEGLWPSLGDPRIKAIIPMAPDGIFFDQAGLAEITIPMLTISGDMDVLTPFDWGSRPAYDYVSSSQKSLVAIESGNHFLFQTSCAQAPWLIEMDIFFMCSDSVWDLDRAHDLINHFSTAFLLDVLKRDPDAHAALLAENVSFPGITYETTMK